MSRHFKNRDSAHLFLSLLAYWKPSPWNRTPSALRWSECGFSWAVYL